jgi:N-acetylmuramoyl-L-alanine amidase
MRLLLDAGHGGTDPGAVAETDTQTLRECDIALVVVMRMREKIEALYPEWEIRLSRVDDSYISPSSRAVLIKRSGVDAAVSIHCNSSANVTAKGHEVIYREDDDYDLAGPINQVMSELLPNRDRGLKSDETDLGRKLALLNTPGIPTVIVEPGFLSNEEDRDILLDTDTLADVLVKGIARWIEQRA